MSDEEEKTDQSSKSLFQRWPSIESYARITERFVAMVEMGAATVFAILFLIGVVDLSLRIIEAFESGEIVDPNTVIDFIDTGLLLLIIVEVYQTVLAYVEESDTRRIVRLVIYTGVIAMVRKVIIFRTSEYSSELNALFVAISYTVIVLGLIGLLVAEQAYGDQLRRTTDE